MLNLMFDLDDLIARIRDFADARDWDQFHTVRNLILALTGEVGELAAEIQWIPDDAIDSLSQEKKAALRAELADVATYVLRLSDVLSIDLAAAIIDKLALNESRYPIDKARGSAAKYTELGGA